jgi:hypothetical protein
MTKNKKPTPNNLKEIVKLRDQLQAAMSKEEKKNEIGMMCKGMFKCSKDNDKKCLEGIENKLKLELENVKPKKAKKNSSKSVEGGGNKRSRSRSKSKSRSRSKNRKR